MKYQTESRRAAIELWASREEIEASASERAAVEQDADAHRDAWLMRVEEIIHRNFGPVLHQLEHASATIREETRARLDAENVEWKAKRQIRDLRSLLRRSRRLMTPARGAWCSTECHSTCNDCKLIAEVDAELVGAA